MPTVTTLATGQIAPHHVIEVRYEQTNGQPATVRVIWPSSPTQLSPVKLADLAAAACRVLANSSVELSRMKAGHER